MPSSIDRDAILLSLADRYETLCAFFARSWAKAARLIRVREAMSDLLLLSLCFFLRLFMRGTLSLQKCTAAFVSRSSQVINASVSDHRGSNYSGGVRQYIQDKMSQRDDYKITGVRSESYIQDMKNSKFCLAPEGKLLPSVRDVVVSVQSMLLTFCICETTDLLQGGIRGARGPITAS